MQFSPLSSWTTFRHGHQERASSMVSTERSRWLASSRRRRARVPLVNSISHRNPVPNFAVQECLLGTMIPGQPCFSLTEMGQLGR